MAEIEVKIPKFRGWYVAAFVPRPVKGDTTGKLLYSVMAVFPPDTDLTPLKEVAAKAAELKWKAQAPAIIKHPKFKPLFKSQSELIDADGQLLPGAEPGGVYLNLSSKVQPLVVGPNAKPTDDEEVIYSGAYFVALAGAFAWEHPTGGRGISFSLKGLQQVAHGEKLGGMSTRAKPEDFEPVAGADVRNASSLFD